MADVSAQKVDDSETVPIGATPAGALPPPSSPDGVHNASNAAPASLREDQIQNAVAFLSHPKVFHALFHRKWPCKGHRAAPLFLHRSLKHMFSALKPLQLPYPLRQDAIETSQQMILKYLTLALAGERVSNGIQEGLP